MYRLDFSEIENEALFEYLMNRCSIDGFGGILDNGFCFYVGTKNFCRECIHQK